MMRSRLAIISVVIMAGSAFAGCATGGAATPPATSIPSPGLSITSPMQGASLPLGPITVTIAVSDFAVVDKLGQANVTGEGHVHYFLDATPPTTPGQPAVTAAGTYAATAELSHVWANVAPGTHTLAVELVNNNHTPLEPPVVAQVTVDVARPSVTIQLSATHTAFDTNTITVPAGADVTVEFTNNDTIYHNFAVYDSPAATTAIFVGDTIQGPAMITYHFTAPETPGSYFFRCDVHPKTMTGTFVVT